MLAMTVILTLVTSASNAGALVHGSRASRANTLCDAFVLYLVERDKATSTDSYNLPEEYDTYLYEDEGYDIIYDSDRPEVRARQFRQMEAAWRAVVKAASGADVDPLARFSVQIRRLNKAIIKKAEQNGGDTFPIIADLTRKNRGEAESLVYLVSALGLKPSQARAFLETTKDVNRIVARRCPELNR